MSFLRGGFGSDQLVARRNRLAAYAIGGVLPLWVHDYEHGYLSSPLVVSRASAGSFGDASGTIQTAAADTPRFDYSSGKRALLLEASSTNLLPNSAQFDASSWAKTRASVVANAALAPDGTMTADKLVEDTSNNSHFLGRTGTQVTGATPVTTSIFVKAAERRWFALVTADSANVFRTSYFDLQTGALGVVSQGGAGHTAQIVAAGNGWYRCSVTQTQAAASGNFNIYLSVVAANGAATYAGDGASGIHLWGAQMEIGSAASSVIPTGASAATRAADYVDPIDLSVFDLSLGYTVLVWGQLDTASGLFDRIITIDAGDAASRHHWVWGQSSAKFTVETYAENVAQAGFGDFGGPQLGQPFKLAHAVGPDYFQAARQGVLSALDTSVIYTPRTALRIAQAFSGSRPSRTSFARLALYPGKLTGTQLGEITT